VTSLLVDSTEPHASTLEVDRRAASSPAPPIREVDTMARQVDLEDQVPDRIRDEPGFVGVVECAELLLREMTSG